MYLKGCVKWALYFKTKIILSSQWYLYHDWDCYQSMLSQHFILKLFSLSESGIPSSSTESYCHLRWFLHSCPHLLDLHLVKRKNKIFGSAGLLRQYLLPWARKMTPRTVLVETIAQVQTILSRYVGIHFEHSHPLCRITTYLNQNSFRVV